MEALTKSLKIISNLFDKLGSKIDNLSRDIKRQKPPVVNVSAPEVTVNVPDVIVPEIKMPGFPEYPAFPEFPEIKLPKIEVNVPEIKVPTINVPKPEVTVNVPEANITVTPTPVVFPSEMKVTGMDQLIAEVSRETEDKSIFEEVTSKRPLSVQIMDSKGKPITNFGSDMTAPSIVGLKNTSSQNINPATEEKQDTQITQMTALPTAFNGEALWLLRRMVKLLESNATVDIANRQRVAVESAIITSGTVTTVGTVSNLALIGGVDPRFTLIEQAKINYNTGVRSHLSFT